MKILQIKLLLILFIFSGLAHAQTINYSDDGPFTIVQDMPRFPGCEDIEGTQDEKKRCAEQKMLEFIYRNITYPTVARENGIEGMVVVSFVVETDGSLSDIMILRDLGGGCGKESVRVVSEMPNWIPGKDKGEPVRVQFNLPVRFKLTGSPSANTRTPLKPKKKQVHFNVHNYSRKEYSVSTPDGWVHIAPKSSKSFKLDEGSQMMYRRGRKVKLLLNVRSSLDGREVDIHNTIKTGMLHVSESKH